MLGLYFVMEFTLLSLGKDVPRELLEIIEYFLIHDKPFIVLGDQGAIKDWENTVVLGVLSHLNSQR